MHVCEGACITECTQRERNAQKCAVINRVKHEQSIISIISEVIVTSIVTILSIMTNSNAVYIHTYIFVFVEVIL